VDDPQVFPIEGSAVKNPILIIIAKEPQVGTTKTRLSPPLNLSQAAALFETLLEDTIDLASSIDGIDLAVAVTPPESIGYFEKKTPTGTIFIPVTCIDIGDCLKQVFEELFGRGYPKVLAFNSDGPSLPKEYIRQAVEQLDANDVVIGPSDDGGYYLVGLNEPHAELFSDIEWSTTQVMEQSLARAEAANLRVALLPEWYDVDTAFDLKRLQEDIHTLPANQLMSTRRFFDRLPPEVRITLADLGSTSNECNKSD
jgi:rSAM/selenodomain-associated transferase 1